MIKVDVKYVRLQIIWLVYNKSTLCYMCVSYYRIMYTNIKIFIEILQ